MPKCPKVTRLGTLQGNFRAGFYPRRARESRNSADVARRSDKGTTPHTCGAPASSRRVRSQVGRWRAGPRSGRRWRWRRRSARDPRQPSDGRHHPAVAEDAERRTQGHRRRTAGSGVDARSMPWNWRQRGYCSLIRRAGSARVGSGSFTVPMMRRLLRSTCVWGRRSGRSENRARTCPPRPCWAWLRDSESAGYNLATQQRTTFTRGRAVLSRRTAGRWRSSLPRARPVRRTRAGADRRGA